MSRPDLVRFVDQTAAGVPVAWVESPVTPEPEAPMFGLTLEEWRARNTTVVVHRGGGDHQEAPSPGLSGGPARGERPGSAAGSLPAPADSSAPGSNPGHHQTRP